MPAIILSDNGVSSGSAGLKTSGSNDGTLALQTSTAGGTATTAVTINTSQNVGVGTTSPSYRLDVDRGASNGVVAKFGRSGGQAAFIYADANYAYFGSDAGISNGIGASSTANLLQFYANSAERMRIDTSGNLLLGSTSTRASAKLDILGNVMTLGANATYYGTIEYSAALGLLSLAAESGGGITFKAGATERGRFDANGSLLIGDTTQAYNNQGYMLSAKSSGNQCILSLAKSGQTLGSGGIILGCDASTGFLWVRENQPLLFGTNNAERARIDTSGNLLVGTTSGSPRVNVWSANTQVTSAFYRPTSTTTDVITIWASNVGGTGADKYYVYANGTAGAASDARQKKNVEKARSYLGDLCNVNIVKYNWVTDQDGMPKELGVIAQELEQVFPGMVATGPQKEDGSEGDKAVKYSVFVPMLITAIQEQQAIIAQLQADVATLKGTP